MKDISVLDDLICKVDCSRRTMQQKKQISDQASVCTQRENKNKQKTNKTKTWKFQKKNVAGGMACKLSGVQPDRTGRVEVVAAQIIIGEFVLYS